MIISTPQNRNTGNIDKRVNSYQVLLVPSVAFHCRSIPSRVGEFQQSRVPLKCESSFPPYPCYVGTKSHSPRLAHRQAETKS